MNMTPVDRLIEALKAQVLAFGLELMQRYPNDLLVHDRRMFEQFWGAGQRFAWMVGHSHTHMAAIGLHVEENKTVSYLLNLSNEDRFFEVVIGSDGESFRIKEIGRDGFKALMSVPVPYHRMGNPDSFTLYRCGTPVGSVAIKCTGPLQQRLYQAVLAPKAEASASDSAALHLWADYACRSLAGSLFYRSEYVVTKPAATLLVA